jgi:phosphopantothenoylcysteine decarboxylase/phosphopantothenate--cysteine ligase
MLEAEELLADIIALFQPKLLSGRRVLITAGATFEALDPVRGLTNLSTGKMGFALARACHEAGAVVTLVAGSVTLPAPRGVARIDVKSALDMRAAVLDRASGNDIFIAVAAVADYRPARVASQKIKKSGDNLTLTLEANPDILAEVAGLPERPFCVGFAAETEKLAEYAEGKRIVKKLPLVVGNLLSDGLGGDCNRVTLFDAAGAHPLPVGEKLTVARAIVAHIARLSGTQEKR